MDKNKINKEFKKHFKVKSIEEFGGTIMIEFGYEPTQTEYYDEKYGIDIEDDGFYDLTVWIDDKNNKVYTGTAKNEKDLVSKVLKHAKDAIGVFESMSKFDQLYNQYLEESLGNRVAFSKMGKKLIAYLNTEGRWDKDMIVIEIFPGKPEKSVLAKLGEEMDVTGISWSWSSRPKTGGPAIAIRKTEDMDALAKIIGKKIPGDWK